MPPPELFKGLLFGDGFLRDHAGQIIEDPRIALVELIANAYDAGACNISVTLPVAVSGNLVLEDDGTGMSPSEFDERWKTLSYNRMKAQGEVVQFPPGVSSGARLAFGKSGKGRHAALCFADEYEVATWKDGIRTRASVRLPASTESPFEVSLKKQTKKKGHGTKISIKLERNLLPEKRVRDLIGGKFLVDPSFAVSINGKAVELLDLGSVETAIVPVPGFEPVRIHLVDTSTQDRRVRLRGLTWWVHKRMVGSPSWSRPAGDSAYIDGRTAEAKRYSFVIEADLLKPDVKADWTGFHASDRRNAVEAAVDDHVEEALSSLMSNARRRKKKSALAGNKEALSSIDRVSRKRVGDFVDQVMEQCPTLSERDLGRTIEIFTKFEEAESGYGLLNQLAKCSPQDLDTWNHLMRNWTARNAQIVLSELGRRLSLIKRMSALVDKKTADELHDLQPLFERGLWIFGPEFEAVDFRSNRTLARVVGEFLGGGEEDSSRRPDFVAMANRSIGFYSSDDYDDQGEIVGIRKLLVVELKRGGFRLRQSELDQARDYTKRLRKASAVQESTVIEAFVLGSTLESDLEAWKTERGTTTVRPATYRTVLRRAQARTFNLQQRLSTEQPKEDPVIQEVLSDGVTANLFS